MKTLELKNKITIILNPLDRLRNTMEMIEDRVHKLWVCNNSLGKDSVKINQRNLPDMAWSGSRVRLHTHHPSQLQTPGRNSCPCKAIVLNFLLYSPQGKEGFPIVWQQPSQWEAVVGEKGSQVPSMGFLYKGPSPASFLYKGASTTLASGLAYGFNTACLLKITMFW